MKTVTATYTTPVTQNVMEIVLSMARQLEAIGVKYQGLRKWNRTEPKTSTRSAMTMAMATSPRGRAQPARASANDANPGAFPCGLPCVRQRGTDDGPLAALPFLVHPMPRHRK